MQRSMGSKVLLDANILLDFFLKRNGHEKIQKIIEMIEDEKIYGFITPAIIHVVGYFLAKHYDKKETKNLLTLLLVNVQVVDAVHATALHALNSKMDDIEDALQYYTAMQHGISYFISNDKWFKKQAIAALPVYTPDEFLSDFS